MKFDIRIGILAGAFCAVLLNACSSDDNDAPSLPSINMSSEEGEMTAIDYNEVIRNKKTGIVRTFVAKLSEPTSSALLCTVAVDSTGVEAYNAAHGTNYVIMPESCYTLNSSDVIIKAGESVSDTLSVTFSSLFGMESGKEYLLPIAVTPDETDVHKASVGDLVYFKCSIDGELDYISGLDMRTYSADMYQTLSFPNDEVVTIDGNTHTFEILVYPYEWRNGTSYISTWKGKDLNNNNENFSGCELRQYHYSSSYYNMSYSQIGNRQCDLTSYSSGISIPSEQWVLITVTCDGTQTGQNSEIAYRLYFNGEEMASSKPTKRWGASSSQKFQVGYTLTGIQFGGTRSSYAFNGIISEVRMWKKCLTADEIKANLRTVKNPSKDEMYGYWRMDETSGNTIKDYSGNGRDLTYPDGVTVLRTAELNDLPQ